MLTWLDRRRWGILALIGVLLCLAYNGQWRINPDSALYAELGRNLSEGQGFTYHGEPHNWVEPGLPYAIAFSFRHFGQDNFHPLMLAMLGCTIAALALTYALFTIHANRQIALLVVTLLGFSETFFRYGFHLFTDMPFLVAVLMFLVGYELIVRENRNRTWIGWPLVVVCIPLMFLIRPAVITFIGAVGVACAWHVVRGPGRVRHVLLGLIVLASFFCTKKLDPRRHVRSETTVTRREKMLETLLGDRLGFAVKRTLTQHVPMMLEETTTEAIFGTKLGPGITSVVSIGIIASSVLLLRRRVLWAAWIAATLAQMAVWLPRERYFVPILPLVLIAIWDATTWLARRFKWAKKVPASLVVALIALNLIYIGIVIIEQRRTPFLAHYAKGEKLRIIAMAQQLHEQVPADAEVIADFGRELSYFSRRRSATPITAARIPPTAAELAAERERLANAGDVYVVLPGKNVEALLKQFDAQVGETIASAGEMTLHHARFTAIPATTQP